MARTLYLRTSTPDGTLFEGEAEQVTVRTVEGDLGILPGHERCAAQLAEGTLRIRTGGSVEEFTVLGGFLTVEADRVVVLSALAERPDKIEEALADLERRRLTHKQDEERSELEVSRAQMAIRRALVGREISAYSVLGKRGEEGKTPEELDHEDA